MAEADSFARHASRQPPTQRKRGCQIDLLSQGENGVFIVEIKRKNEIGSEIESEIAEKVKALALPRDVSVRTALVYDGHLASAVEAHGYIDVLIPASELFWSITIFLKVGSAYPLVK